MSIYTGVDNTVKTIKKLYTGRASVVRSLPVIYGGVDGVVKELHTDYVKENVAGLRLYFLYAYTRTYDTSTSSWSSYSFHYSMDEIPGFTVTTSGGQYTVSQNSDNFDCGIYLNCYLQLADGSLVRTGVNDVIRNLTQKILSLSLQMYISNFTTGGNSSYSCSYLTDSVAHTYTSFLSGSLNANTWYSSTATSIDSSSSETSYGNIRIGRSGYNGRRGQNLFNFYSATWDGKSIPVTVYTTKAP